MVALGEGALSCERGTPVPPRADAEGVQRAHVVPVNLGGKQIERVSHPERGGVAVD
jgi:hypothetical protein